MIEQYLEKKELEPEIKLEASSLVKKAKTLVLNEISEELKQMEFQLVEMNDKLKTLAITSQETDDIDGENK